MHNELNELIIINNKYNNKYNAFNSNVDNRIDYLYDKNIIFPLFIQYLSISFFLNKS